MSEPDTDGTEADTGHETAEENEDAATEGPRQGRLVEF